MQIVADNVALDHSEVDTVGSNTGQKVIVNTHTGDVILGPHTRLQSEHVSVQSALKVEMREQTIVNVSGRGGTGYEVGSPQNDRGGASHAGLGAKYDVKHQPPFRCQIRGADSQVGSMKYPSLPGAGVLRGGRGGGVVDISAQQVCH